MVFVTGLSKHVKSRIIKWIPQIGTVRFEKKQYERGCEELIKCKEIAQRNL